MEEQWYADRGQLRALLRAHPSRSTSELAAQLGRSTGWVKKWKRRLRAAPPDDEAVLRGRSRARRQPPPAVAQAVVDKRMPHSSTPKENSASTSSPTMPTNLTG